MYILFENFKLCFNIAIFLILFSDETKDWTHSGNNSLALYYQSLTQVPKEDQIDFAAETYECCAA